jgi:hypothetical protein
MLSPKSIDSVGSIYLRPKSLTATFSPMKHVRKKTSIKEQLEDAILEIGGEPLQGSGFEDEAPDPGDQ